ncbi:hypothetical protein HHI36_003941 [Cryptolaemus montrouzieri]|uniref:Uncharacterized protein n=1 Tax=Cryptolaemus montrouzieri TaxID=559131 RepID=A0ABD2NQC3_9CUCU
MQSVQNTVQGVRVSVDKSVESVSASDIVKKISVSANPDRECRVPRVTNSRDSSSALNLNPTEHFPSKIGDKYLLLDQVEGSSLYRCVDTVSKDELVCKVSCF